MDNNTPFQIPGASGPQPYDQPQPIPPAQPVQPNYNGQLVQQVVAAPPQKDTANLIKTIVIIVLSLVAATFVGLFIWMFIRYDAVSTDVEGQIKIASAKAVEEKTTELEAEFLQREKEPNTDFSGPEDYGQLSFRYPKTWNLYVASDAANGGDYEAYFNPGSVNPISDSNVNALRLTILNKPFDDVAANYEKEMKKKNSNLTIEAVKIGVNEDISANRYTGTIPGTEFSGYIVIFKIRDKTAVVQTDSTFFQEDYDKLLKTIIFNS